MKKGLTLLVAAALCASVQAEERGIFLSATQGSVLVNQGVAYVPATDGMALNATDQLMTMGGGSAVISFAENCQRALGENEIVQVGNVDQCAVGFNAGNNLAVGSTVAGGGGAAGGSLLVPVGLMLGVPLAAKAAYDESTDDDDDASR